MSSLLCDKKILILGATGRIGRSVSIRLAKCGHKLILHGRNEDALCLLMNELSDLGADVCKIQADIEVPQQASSLLKDAASFYQGFSGVINCIGIFDDFSLEKNSCQFYDRIFSVNFSLIAQIIAGSIEFMPPSGGIIISLSSLAGKYPLPHSPMYSASKFAIFGFFESLYERFKRKGIKVCVVGTGQVSTLITKDESLDALEIPVDDVAALVEFIVGFSSVSRSCLSEVLVKPVDRRWIYDERV
ncbi:SDR family NAD(P)-dependent oxidoreductase [Pseudomonas aeruginosa]|uniref:SDR family NAD(P)-dependent oxidoreductase n=1 Tax=Pseudomonas aeruginosa TaxID=287 RepID=UPI000D68867D|nr:SDR family NAD(P)-dependent oxidoreductase [Pseudomonas aeruginosa]